MASERSRRTGDTTQTPKPQEHDIGNVTIDIETIKAVRIAYGGQGVIVPNPPRPKMFTLTIEGIGIVRSQES